VHRRTYYKFQVQEESIKCAGGKQSSKSFDWTKLRREAQGVRPSSSHPSDNKSSMRDSEVSPQREEKYLCFKANK
jgi:hypothetical protein